jgi:hypothetical protein
VRHAPLSNLTTNILAPPLRLSASARTPFPLICSRRGAEARGRKMEAKSGSRDLCHILVADDFVMMLCDPRDRFLLVIGSELETR